MSIENKDKLKSYFVTGAEPTEEQFANLIDSIVSLNELPKVTLTKASQSEAEQGIANDRYMTPLRVKAAIAALTSLSVAQLTDVLGKTSDIYNDSEEWLATAKAVNHLRGKTSDAMAKAVEAQNEAQDALAKAKIQADWTADEKRTVGGTEFENPSFIRNKPAYEVILSGYAQYSRDISATGHQDIIIAHDVPSLPYNIFVSLQKGSSDLQDDRIFAQLQWIVTSKQNKSFTIRLINTSSDDLNLSDDTTALTINYVFVTRGKSTTATATAT